MEREIIFDFFRNDHVIGNLVENVGFLPELTPQGSAFEALCKSVVSQQLSLKAAATIYSRFREFTGNSIEPKIILETSTDELRTLGFSFQKASYLHNISRFWIEEIDDETLLHDLDDAQMVEFLTRIKGVGEWTVHMLLIFHFKRPNVLPLGDLIVKNGIIHFYKIDTGGKNILHECKKATEHWEPYASYGSRYLWALKNQIL